MVQATIAQGSVHGRFQPFHNEHLEYVLRAYRRCGFLWVGITKYDLDTETSPLGREREKPANNPLTYSERITIITAALRDEGISPDTFAFVPFPIEHPQKLKQFISPSVTCFTTICEKWNLEKIEVLKKEGYSVEVLWEREKKVTGSFIREQILKGNSVWKELVPAATVKAVERLDLHNRLTMLSESL